MTTLIRTSGGSTKRELDLRTVKDCLVALFCCYVSILFHLDGRAASRDTRALSERGMEAAARVVGEHVKRVTGVTIYALDLEWVDRQQNMRTARVSISGGYRARLGHVPQNPRSVKRTTIQDPAAETNASDPAVQAAEPNQPILVTIRYLDDVTSMPIVTDDAGHRQSTTESSHLVGIGFLLICLFYAGRGILRVWWHRAPASAGRSSSSP